MFEFFCEILFLLRNCGNNNSDNGVEFKWKINVQVHFLCVYKTENVLFKLIDSEPELELVGS